MTAPTVAVTPVVFQPFSLHVEKSRGSIISPGSGTKMAEQQKPRNLEQHSVLYRAAEQRCLSSNQSHCLLLLLGKRGGPLEELLTSAHISNTWEWCFTSSSLDSSFKSWPEQNTGPSAAKNFRESQSELITKPGVGSINAQRRGCQ